MSLRVGNFCGLNHELGDVGEESALAEIDLFERDGGEKLREDTVDVGGSFETGAGTRECGGNAVGFGGGDCEKKQIPRCARDDMCAAGLHHKRRDPLPPYRCP